MVNGIDIEVRGLVIRSLKLRYGSGFNRFSFNMSFVYYINLNL